jgi:hypothetical protein
MLLTCALAGWVAMAPGVAARQPTAANVPTAGVQLPGPAASSPLVLAASEPSALPQILAYGGRAGGSIYQPAPNVHIALGRQAAEQAQVAATGAGGAPSSTTNMSYHSGPTQQTLVAYTIFWSPHSSISSSYQTLINRYFQDIGGSSFYNVVSQYPGLADTQNVSTLGGTWIDADPYPAGKGTAIAPLSHTDISTEVARALSLNPSWNPAGLDRMYFVYTEPGIESCWDPTVAHANLSCTPGVASPNPVECAYHSAVGTLNNPVIYANMPYGETWPGVCRDFGTSPNGDIAADAEISISSHEQFEAVTDPLLDGWFDSDSTGEIGDKCAYKYGSIMPDGHNLTLNGHPYIAQLEWSNANNDGVTSFSGCVDRWGAFNFLWYADKSANPADPNACDLAEPIPPNSPYATGLCASFDLQLPDGNYSLRSIWQLNGSIISDATFPNTHLYSGNWNLSSRGLSASGIYSLILYGDGVLLGSGSVTVSGATPSPTPSPTPQWSASSFRWYELLPSGYCDLTKPIPSGGPFPEGLCATYDLQIPDASYTRRTVWTLDGATLYDYSNTNSHLYPGTWNNWVTGLLQPGTYSLTLYASGVFLGTGQIVIIGSPTLGNANCDDKIDGMDVLAILTDSSACPHNADVDGDGHVTPFDALFILKYWAGVITTFPASGS